MKGYRFIYAKQCIAGYMVAFKTNKMTVAEFNRFAQFLEKTLTTEEYQAIAFCGKRYLDELKREDDGFLFNIGDSTIKLADGKSKHDLDEHILSYVETDVLLEMLHSPSKYRPSKENKELSL